MNTEKVENEYRDYVKKIDTETMLTLYNTIQHYTANSLSLLTVSAKTSDYLYISS